MKKIEKIKAKIDIFINNDLKQNIKPIIELIKTYILERGIQEKDILTYQEEKNNIRGKFEKRIFAYLFLIKKEDISINSYRERKDEYREILMSKNNYSEDHAVFECNKLVRDKVPERFETVKERILFYRILTLEEFKEALKKKLIEELAELERAQKTSEIIEEAADVLTVLEYF